MNNAQFKTATNEKSVSDVSILASWKSKKMMTSKVPHSISLIKSYPYVKVIRNIGCNSFILWVIVSQSISDSMPFWSLCIKSTNIQAEVGRYEASVIQFHDMNPQWSNFFMTYDAWGSFVWAQDISGLRIDIIAWKWIDKNQVESRFRSTVHRVKDLSSFAENESIYSRQNVWRTKRHFLTIW